MDVGVIGHGRSLQPNAECIRGSCHDAPSALHNANHELCRFETFRDWTASPRCEMLRSPATRRHSQRTTQMAILPNLQQENEALKAALAEMQARLATASAPRAITMKVSDKGAISIYGLGRFPVTLYRGQMERLLAASPEITAFIDRNAALL